MPCWITPTDCRAQDLAALIRTPTDPRDYPLAQRITRGIPVYSSDPAWTPLAAPSTRRALQTEWQTCLQHGPGVLILTAAVPADAVNAAGDVFRQLIAAQHNAGRPVGDHFAQPGANDRIWNAHQKLALHSPEIFCNYYASRPIAAVCEAWLGPAYQLTSQVNVVNPGAEAQAPHRDYHLGFMTDRQAAAYPAHVHTLSPLLTLQGAVAHSDMPLASGPTQVLPYSQRYPAGYLAWRNPAFQTLFADHHVQLPLATGDAIFFNPALLHAAGANRTDDTRRMANLLQISSAFGRAMERLDRRAMIRALYPALARRHAAGATVQQLDPIIAAGAEGYPFPNDLDAHPPRDGLAPATDADITRYALTAGWSEAAFATALEAGAAPPISPPQGSPR